MSNKFSFSRIIRGADTELWWVRHPDAEKSYRVAELWSSVVSDRTEIHLYLYPWLPWTEQVAVLLPKGVGKGSEEEKTWLELLVEEGLRLVGTTGEWGVQVVYLAGEPDYFEGED